MSTRPPKHSHLAFLFCGILVCILFVQNLPAQPQTSLNLRVGIFNNKPMCYLDEDLKPAGIFVKVLEDIASKENWHITYVHESFSTLRTQLQQGEIDMLLSTALSKERLKLYDYNQTNVFNNWGEVYVRPSDTINSLLDLKEKRIAVLTRGIFATGPDGIIQLNERFGLKCQFIYCDDYKVALAAVHNDLADGAVVNRLTGATYADTFKLKRSGIVFAPVNIRFAFNKDNPQNPTIIAAIDTRLKALIQNKNSIYHQAIDQALGGRSITVKEVIPAKVWLTLIGGITVTICLLIIVLFLRWKIKRAEATIKKNERKFRNLVESTNTVPWELDLKTEQFTYMGKQVEDVLGYPVESWTDLDTWTKRLHPQDRQNALLYCSTQSAQGADHDFIYRALHQDGSQRWIRDIVAVTMGAKGPEKLIGFMHDITAQKNMTLEKQNLEIRLQQAQKMEAIGTLAGGIAHDFNNILAAIIGYSEMAREDSPDGTSVANDLDKVLNASNRAKELVKQILAFSRQADTERIPLQPAHIIKEALKILRPSLPSTITIREKISQDIGLIHADPTQVNQIIINLATNAFHAMEETGGTLSISLQQKNLTPQDIKHEPTVKAGQFMQLTISDTGTGMSPEIQHQIFNPYFTTKDTGKGTGMGLSIVHGITKSYGGFITLNSVAKQGTTFRVFLPISEEMGTEQDQNEAPIPMGRERILFVDDEPLLTEMGQDMLERLGYQVTVRNSSIEALKTFQNEPDQFDIIITDQTMPGITGTDLARRILQIRPTMPIILCTGYSSQISEKQAKDFGIREFALKPLAKHHMATLIRKVLD